MRRNILLIWFFILFLTGCHSNKGTQDLTNQDTQKLSSIEGERIQVPEHHFSLVVPKGWQKGPTSWPVVLSIYAPSNSDFVPNINVVISEPLDEAPKTLSNKEWEEFLQMTIEDVKQEMPSFEKTAEERIEIAGHVGYRLEGIAVEPTLNVKVHFVQYIIYKDKAFFVLTAGAKEDDFIEYKEIFEGIARSIQFI